MFPRSTRNNSALSALLAVDDDVAWSRRGLLLSPLLATLPLAMSTVETNAGAINSSETVITLPDSIDWGSWIDGFPPHSGQIATLYGGFDQPVRCLVPDEGIPGHS